MLAPHLKRWQPGSRLGAPSCSQRELKHQLDVDRWHAPDHCFDGTPFDGALA
jgi:hypothetical protein